MASKKLSSFAMYFYHVVSSTALRELGFKVADNLETIEVSKFPGEICNRNFEVFE